MPRYFFHLFNDETSLDEEGKILSNDAAALRQGEEDARVMAADSVRHGHLVLNHRIEVACADGRKLAAIHFGDVVKVES